MADNDENFIYVRERRLPYETFDADNHLYENRDALTKFVPKEYEGAVKYVDIEGRTKLALRDQISNYIPNPTFSKVAVPGGWCHAPGQAVRRTRVKPKIDAGRRRVLRPRAALRADEGHGHRPHAAVADARVACSRSASPTTPTSPCALVHALNQWMHEHWSFVYSDAIYSTPIISLAAGPGPALEELQYIHERGAKIFLIRVAPGPHVEGPQVVRAGGVRPVLGRGPAARRRRRHALRRLRLPALRERVERASTSR